MIQLAKLFGTFGTGGWIIYAVIAAAIYAAGGLSGAKVQRVIDAPTISQLKTDVATARGDAQTARTALAEQQKQIALDLAAANQRALEAKNLQDKIAAALTAQQKQNEQDRVIASNKLLDALRAVPHDQQAALPLSSRNYLRGVRDEQARAAGSSPTPN